MTLSLKVYDPTNTTLQGTLSEAHGVGFLADLRTPGTLRFDVNLASTADTALLQGQRVIRVNDGTNDIEAFIVQDTPAEWAPSDEIPRKGYDCRHLLTWLGYQQGGAVLWPYKGLSGSAPRWFGPYGFDFPTLVGIPEPTTGGALTRENWQDPFAERFVFTDRAVYRRYLTGNPALAGPARMWLTSAAWTVVRVWLDGEPVDELSTQEGDRSIRMWDMPYDGQDHVICFDCESSTHKPAGVVNSLGWTWAKLDPDSLGEYNDWGEMEGRIFTTFNSTTYSGPTAPSTPYWQAWEDYADGGYPGVNVGFTMKTAVDEAQARGLLPSLTYDFDGDVDSDAVAWEHDFARAFRPQKLGPLVDVLSAYNCEPELTPGNVLKLHQLRGTDRTATVTITVPFALSSTGRGPQATRYLLETQGGFGSATDTTAETALGVKLEDVLPLGEDIHPHTVVDAVALQLARDSGELQEYDIDLPDDVVPYVDVFLGDRVTCQSSEDPAVTATMRILSFTAQEADEGTQWSAVLELWSP